MLVLWYILTYEKENIIKYESAFKYVGKIHIVMELAVNDLETYRKARQGGKGRPYLSLPCIQSIGRQALTGLEYLHGEGYMHRDLKPQNILVTKWDARTDTPTIKLADFGLAGKGSQRQTFCGTEGYMAPEITGNRVSSYTNAVDIWALGKILLVLLRDVPSHGPSHKILPLSLIRRMMENEPEKRPTAAECLKDRWIAAPDTGNSRLAKKRGRSPAPSTSSPSSSTEQPLRKVMRTAIAATKESPSIMMMNAIWSLDSHNDALMGPLAATRDENFSVAIQPNHDHPQETSSIQEVADSLLAALQAEGYGKNVTVAGNITEVGMVREEISRRNVSRLQARQQSQSSIMLRLDFDGEERTSSFWNNAQSSDPCLEMIFGLGPPS